MAIGDGWQNLERLQHARVVGTRTCLAVCTGDHRIAIWVDCRPDPDRARTATAGLRRLLAVVLVVDGNRIRATLSAVGGRRTINRPIPVPAALALAAERIPTYLFIHPLAK